MTVVTTPRVLATVPSKSNPNKSYEIRLGKDGVVYCSCRAWITNKYCKHLEEYHQKNMLLGQNINPAPGKAIPVSSPSDVMIKFFEDAAKALGVPKEMIKSAVEARDNITRIVQDGIIGGKW